MQLLLLTVVLTLPSVEQLSYRNPRYVATADKIRDFGDDQPSYQVLALMDKDALVASLAFHGLLMETQMIWRQTSHMDESGVWLLGKWYIIRWAGNLPISAKKKLIPLPPFTFVKNILSNLEFRMNVSKPTGCVEFKISLDEDENKPSNFYIWPKQRITIEFLGGKNFAIAFHVSKAYNLTLTMAMLMGQNMAPKRTMLLDFEDTVEDLGMNKTEIIHPKCDDSCELSREI